MAAERELSVVVTAQDKASSKISGMGSKIGSALGTIGTGVAAAGAAALVAGAAIVAFTAKAVGDFSEMGSAVQDMADRTGLATESISGLRVAAQLSGTSIDSVEGAVKKMTLQNLNAATASDGLKKALSGVGVSINDLKNLSPDKQFSAYADAIAHTENVQDRARLATEAFGKAGSDLLPMLANGKFSLEEFNKQAKDLGLLITPEMADNASKLGDAFDMMGMAMQGLSIQIGAALGPALLTLFENLKPLLPILQSLISNYLHFLALEFQFVSEKVNQLYDYLKQTGVITAFQNAFQMVADAYTQSLLPALMQVYVALTPFFPLFESIGRLIGTVFIVVLLAMIVAFASFIQILGGVIGKVAEVAGKLTAELKPAIDAAAGWINGLSTSIMGVVTWFNNAVSAIDRFLTKAREAASALTGGVLNVVTGGLSGKRASGGPVTAGRTYMVGENGPELFTPPTGGSITPNNQLGGGGGVGVSVNIQVGSISSDMDTRRLAQQVGDILLGKLQNNMGI